MSRCESEICQMADTKFTFVKLHFSIQYTVTQFRSFKITNDGKKGPLDNRVSICANGSHCDFFQHWHVKKIVYKKNSELGHYLDLSCIFTEVGGSHIWIIINSRLHTKNVKTLLSFTGSVQTPHNIESVKDPRHPSSLQTYIIHHTTWCGWTQAGRYEPFVEMLLSFHTETLIVGLCPLNMCYYGNAVCSVFSTVGSFSFNCIEI